MTAKDYRQSAWQSLKGKWGVCVLSFAIFDLISGALAGSNANRVLGMILSIAGLIILGPLTIGLYVISLKVARDKDVEIGMLFNGFKDFKRSWILWFTNDILTFLWSLLLIVPGIIKALSYSMSYYILLDDPNISPNEARKKSMAMMKGNKGRLFCLYLSYIGWFLLSIITIGILFFWVGPYLRTAEAKFYLSLLPEEEKREGEANDGSIDSGSVNVDDLLNKIDGVDLDLGDDSDPFASKDEFSKDADDDVDFSKFSNDDDEFKF